MKLRKSGIFLAALCAAGLIGGCAAPLKNTVWVPEKLENQGSVKLVEPVPVWFEINETNMVYGNSGANRFSTVADVDQEKGALSFRPGAATLMAGPNLGYETKFNETMKAVRSYSICGDTLTVYDENGRELGTFKAGSPELKKQK
ncbi:MAG: META domain-containing protein [Lentisphaeria bacterium]|nr:META domain-containing protein [Lentisphaeria bacterium]